MEQVLHDAYAKALELRKLSSGQEVENVVKTIYKPFTAEEISAKMVELLKPEGVRAKVEIVYQSLEGLHQAIPNHPGDWYFSGDYPTPGGAHLVNEAFISYMEEDYGK